MKSIQQAKDFLVKILAEMKAMREDAIRDEVMTAEQADHEIDCMQTAIENLAPQAELVQLVLRGTTMINELIVDAENHVKLIGELKKLKDEMDSLHSKFVGQGKLH